MTRTRLEIFETQRPALTALCYRMLGEVGAAEDAVQDTWLRWADTDTDQIRNPAAWLRKTATRVALDALRSARARRETYVGPWLPEPLAPVDPGPDGADRFALAQDCELALLWAMERLTPPERAALILRSAFDASYAEIAQVLDRSDAACRQLVSRARKQVQSAGPRFDAPADQVAALIARFSAAMAAQDHAQALALMAPDAVWISDGGARVRAARRPLVGPAEIIQVSAAVLAQAAPLGLIPQPMQVNGTAALALWQGAQIHSLITLAPDPAGRIAWIYTLRNPDKLAQLTRSTMVA